MVVIMKIKQKVNHTPYQAGHYMFLQMMTVILMITLFQCFNFMEIITIMIDSPVSRGAILFGSIETMRRRRSTPLMA